MCHSTGWPPISTIGFGFSPVSSCSRVPKPPARIATFMRCPLQPMQSTDSASVHRHDGRPHRMRNNSRNRGLATRSELLFPPLAAMLRVDAAIDFPYLSAPNHEGFPVRENHGSMIVLAREPRITRRESASSAAVVAWACRSESAWPSAGRWSTSWIATKSESARFKPAGCRTSNPVPTEACARSSNRAVCEHPRNRIASRSRRYHRRIGTPIDEHFNPEPSVVQDCCRACSSK